MIKYNSSCSRKKSRNIKMIPIVDCFENCLCTLSNNIKDKTNIKKTKKWIKKMDITSNTEFSIIIKPIQTNLISSRDVECESVLKGTVFKGILQEVSEKLKISSLHRIPSHRGQAVVLLSPHFQSIAWLMGIPYLPPSFTNAPFIIIIFTNSVSSLIAIVKSAPSIIAPLSSISFAIDVFPALSALLNDEMCASLGI